jgi:NAD(P)-dependent dehydrogenase (short-subunit alcohol dehydrogenase family)
MTIADKAVLVTAANRGIGRALVEEALRRGARQVYAGTRVPLAHPDGRVMPLTLDVTSAGQIQAAVEQVGALDILINNAGIALYDDLSDRAVLERHLAVNLFGTYGVTQAFLPLLTRSRGAIGGVEMTGPGQLRTIRGPAGTAGRPCLAPAGCPRIPGAEGRGRQR